MCCWLLQPERILTMWKYTVDVTGMMCGMCESHTNDAIRKNFDVKKVTSIHSKNPTVIIGENEIDPGAMKKVITDLGYDMGDIRKETAKKGLLGWK